MSEDPEDPSGGQTLDDPTPQVMHDAQAINDLVNAHVPEVRTQPVAVVTAALPDVALEDHGEDASHIIQMLDGERSGPKHNNITYDDDDDDENPKKRRKRFLACPMCKTKYKDGSMVVDGEACRRGHIVIHNDEKWWSCIQCEQRLSINGSWSSTVRRHFDANGVCIQKTSRDKLLALPGGMPGSRPPNAAPAGKPSNLMLQNSGQGGDQGAMRHHEGEKGAEILTAFPPAGLGDTRQVVRLCKRNQAEKLFPNTPTATTMFVLTLAAGPLVATLADYQWESLSAVRVLLPTFNGLVSNRNLVWMQRMKSIKCAVTLHPLSHTDAALTWEYTFENVLRPDMPMSARPGSCVPSGAGGSVADIMGLNEQELSQAALAPIQWPQRQNQLQSMRPDAQLQSTLQSMLPEQLQNMLPEQLQSTLQNMRPDQLQSTLQDMMPEQLQSM